jgi:hypothetical protein
MHDLNNVERRVVDQFVTSLRELPDVHAELGEMGDSDRRNDVRLDLVVAGKPVIVLIEFKKSVYPRDAREVHWKFTDLRHDWAMTHDNDAHPVLVAESISPGAKEILKAERWGYYDSGGSLYLPASGAFLYVDKPPPKAAVKKVRTLFSGRRAQVILALLVYKEKWFGVTGIAEKARVSASTAAEVLAELDRNDWTEARGRGPAKERHLRDPSALLDAWAAEVRKTPPPTLQRYFVPSARSDALVAKVAHAFGTHSVSYAITHEAAAQRYAPFLTTVSQVRCRVQFGQALQSALDELDARPVKEGANLALIEAGDLLCLELDGDLLLASPVQVYLDLLRGEGRAKEAAEHLRKEKIGF